MSIVLFSSKGIHYQDKSRGPILAIFVPQLGGIRRFTDIQNNNAKEIATRYGATKEKPIFKVERGQIIVYGLVSPELSQRVEDVSVYLPEQLLPPKSNAFYLIFGTHVVHGLQEKDDEGRTDWKIALLTHPEKQNRALKKHEAEVSIEEQVAQQVVASLAERMIENDDLDVTIAVTGNNTLLKLLQEKLAPYDVEAVRFETLRRQKKEKPLYRQYNYSLTLLSMALASLVLLGASGFHWYQKGIELKTARAEITRTRHEIIAIEKNPHVGHIQSPQRILDIMKKPVTYPPSSILNAAALIGGDFGRLNTVKLDVTEDALAEAQENNNQGNYNQTFSRIKVRVDIEEMKNAFLVDQEKLAKRLLQQNPWLEEVKNYSRNMNSSNVVLELFLSLGKQEESQE